MTLKQFVIATLRHDNVQRINFKYGPIQIYPHGYSRNIAACVENGHIMFTLVNGRENAFFTSDKQPGQTHTMALPAEYVESSSANDRDAGMLNVKAEADLGVRGNALFRGSIIHESTHALQDYQRKPSDPETSEGAAYLAGWMASVLWGHERLELESFISPPSSSHAVARRLAELRVDGLIPYEIPRLEVARLNGLVLTGSSSRYIFNGI